ncbi:MAG: hypothetical protein M1816_005895 [Peltula sp. TS41687]|nr:MAG: hypothetical protein M1816_005895 [Peltula sp. TS41687]
MLRPGKTLERTRSELTINNSDWSRLIVPADFLVYDRERGLEILGDAPSYEFIFNVSNSYHEAPVYVPWQDRLYISELKPSEFLPPYVVNLNRQPLVIDEIKLNPPLFAANDAQYVNGSIYWAVAGGSTAVRNPAIEQRPGIYKTDPATGETVCLLNNYYGYYFNGLNDLAVHDNGDIWFTDTNYAWWNNLTDTPPQKNAAVYRFRPSTGAVNIVEESLQMANGIEFSPDQKTLYVTDSGSAGIDNPIIAQYGHVPSTYNYTGHHTIYAYDVVDELYITSKRPIYQVQSLAPDGMKVAANGYIITTSGWGADIFDRYGTVMVRIATNFTVNNMAFAGPDLKQLWLTGVGGIARVEMNLEGQY